MARHPSQYTSDVEAANDPIKQKRRRLTEVKNQRIFREECTSDIEALIQDIPVNCNVIKNSFYVLFLNYQIRNFKTIIMTIIIVFTTKKIECMKENN